MQTDDLTVVDVVDKIARTTPPTAVAVLDWHTTVSTGVYVLTAIYVVLQIVVIFPRAANTIKKLFKRDKGGGDAS